MSTSLNTSVGQPVSAELPNITGNLGCLWIDGNVTDGSFVVTKKGNYRAGAGSNDGKYKININASRCSSIYKDSATTVVPESLITNFYIKY